jgi:hypothetical protein
VLHIFFFLLVTAQEINEEEKWALIVDGSPAEIEAGT